MKVLVTGVAGQLGHDVMQELAKREIPAVGTDLKEGIPLDITDEKAVHQVLQKEKPTVILHCAAWTAVDLAEEEQNKKTVYAIFLQIMFLTERERHPGSRTVQSMHP